MGSVKISDLTVQADIISTDKLLIETAGGLSRQTTPAALFAGFNPSGVIMPYAGISAPAGYLLCDGASVSRSAYAALWAVISASKGTFTTTIANPGVVTLSAHGFGTGDAVYLTTTGALPTGLTASTTYYVYYINATTFSLCTTYANAIAGTRITTSGSQSGTHSIFHAPYGIPAASTTNFYLPDMRSATLRGVGTPTKYTVNSIIQLGSYLDDQIQGHRHSPLSPATGFYAPNAGTASIPSSSTYGSSATTGDPTTDTVNGTPRTGTETRVKSVGVNYIIKY